MTVKKSARSFIPITDLPNSSWISFGKNTDATSDKIRTKMGWVPESAVTREIGPLLRADMKVMIPRYPKIPLMPNCVSNLTLEKADATSLRTDVFFRRTM